jgi:hypothetical protein
MFKVHKIPFKLNFLNDFTKLEIPEGPELEKSIPVD